MTISDNQLVKNIQTTMGFLDYLKSKTGKIDTPAELKHLISKEDFNSLLTFANTHLANKGYANISFADGLLFYESFEGGVTKNQTNFLNLVKSVLCENKKVWQIKTEEYLDYLLNDRELENEILLDSVKAKDYLTVRLHPNIIYQNEPNKSHLESLIYKFDIPETYSLLALDLPNSFHILTISEINNWGIDRMMLFEIAFNNLRDKIENIQLEQHYWDDAIFYTLFDRDFSAAYCIDFANNCNSLIGEKGSLVSFPTKGSVFVHPISDERQFNVGYNHIVEKTNNFFDDDPGPITRNIYWFYKNKFTLFEMTWDNGQVTYIVPKQLFDLLQ